MEREKPIYTHKSTSMLKRPRKNSVSISDCKNKNKMVFDKCFVARIYVFICVCLYEYAYKLYIYDDIYIQINVCIYGVFLYNQVKISMIISSDAIKGC